MTRPAKYKIGVFGSAGGDYQQFMVLAAMIGEALGEYADSVIVITGACTGLPYAAARAASAKGCEVWGYSSSFNQAGLTAEYPDDELSVYSKLIYMPADFPFADNDRACKKYRNIISTANCDAGIFVSGLWGTLNEFTNLIDFQKTAGVLTGSGGIADELPGLTSKIHKEGQGSVLFDNDPNELVARLIESISSA
jgi:predicted Rossmann-fold nucleotide-binding protein